jgi:hypothetical protein
LSTEEKTNLHNLLTSYFPTLYREETLDDTEESSGFYQGTYLQFVNHYPEAKDKRVVAIDLGGGSTEFAVGCSETATSEQSVHYGDTNHALGENHHFKAKELNSIRVGAKNKALEELGKNSRLKNFSKPDYFVYGFLQTQVQQYLAPYLKRSNNIDILDGPVDKKVLASLIKTNDQIEKLQSGCVPLMDAYVAKTQRPDEKNNLGNLPKNIAILLGYMDALETKQVYFADYGGVKAGYLDKIAEEFKNLPTKTFSA